MTIQDEFLQIVTRNSPVSLSIPYSMNETALDRSQKGKLLTVKIEEVHRNPIILPLFTSRIADIIGYNCDFLMNFRFCIRTRKCENCSRDL